MILDEQGQSTTTQNQTAESLQNGSEAGKTPDRSEAEGLKAEMLRERQARQALEAQLTSPEFIYNQAKALGMTNEEALAQAEAAPETQTRPQAQVKPQELTWETIEARMTAQRQAEKAAEADHATQIKDHPELATDPVLNDLFQTYARTMKFSDAAEKVLALQEKRSLTKTPEQIEAAKRETESAKAQATTGRTGTLTAAEADDVTTLNNQLHNRRNPSAQSAALFELLRTGKL